MAEVEAIGSAPGTASGRRRAAGAAAWALAAVVAAGHGAFLAALVPPFHSPDEPAHFDYVQRLAEARSLPVKRARCDGFSAELRAVEEAVHGVAFRPDRAMPPLQDIRLPDPAAPESRATPGCSPSTPYPPLYYGSVAGAYLAAGRGTLLERLYACRIASVAWGVVGVIAAFSLGARLWRGAAGGVLLSAAYALQPMVALLSATVNNDAAIFACAAAAFAAIAYLRGAARPLVPLLALALFTTAGVLSKPTFALAFPTLFAFAVLALGPRRRAAWAVAIAAFLPAGVAHAAWSAYSAPIAADLLRGEGMSMSLSTYLREWVLRPGRVEWLSTTYWMTWGWLDTPLAAPYYRALELLLLLAIAGIVLGWRSIVREERWITVVGVAGTAVFAAALYGIELWMMRRTPFHGFLQGRYLLPLYPLHAIVIIVGLRALAARFRVRLDPAWMLPALLALLDAASIATALGRYHA
jgi:4-amino-4-deoxy-L-arabinose transferase-like glycosyltransferase